MRFVSRGLDDVISLVTREGQEDIVETRLAKRQARERQVIGVDAPQSIGRDGGSAIDRQLNDGAVSDRGHIGEFLDEFQTSCRVFLRVERERQDGCSELSLQFRGCAFGDRLTVVEDDQLLGQAVGFFEILGRQQDRGATFDQVLNHTPQVLATLGVQTGGRLIEKEKRGLGDERRGEVESSAHTAGIRLGGTVGGIGESELLEKFAGSTNDDGGFHVVQLPDHSEVLESREALVHCGVLASETDESTHSLGVANHVVSHHRGGTALRLQNGGQDADHRGLTGTVGSEQAEHLTGGHIERDAVERPHLTLTEGTYQILALDSKVSHWGILTIDGDHERGVAAARYPAPMAFADGEIAQVRAATDIVAVISEHVALKRAGRRWTGLCPFHGEKTPSFSVNAEQGVYYCFGCRASGDAIKFVREIQHLDFRDAVQFLADKAGIQLHEEEGSGPKRKERLELMDAMARAVDWYHERLLTSPDAGRARQYLRARGIDGDTVRQFKLGWAPDAWDALATSLKLPVHVLTGTGLGFENSRGRRQDALRARVVFPIFDTSGKPIALGGRILPPSPEDPPRTDGRVEPKYKNSPETAIYSKRRTLYALNVAKDDIIKSGEILVCEGYTDVIGFFQAGLPRAVATCGTALSEDHFRTMKNFARRIVLAYDADAAGQSAAASVYQWERKHEVDVAVVQLPKGMDPGELAQKDPDALREAVATAMPFLQFRLDRVLLSANLSSAEGRARAAEMALDVVAEHPVELVRDQYLQQVADRCRVDVEKLRPMLDSAIRRGPRSDAPATPAEERTTKEPVPFDLTSSPRPGLAALSLLIHQPDSVTDRFEAAYFIDETQRAAFEALAGGALVADAVDALERREERAAAQLIRQVSVSDDSEGAAGEKEVSEVVAQLLRASVGEELKNIDRDLRAGLVTPASAISVIRDVKLRLAELDGADAPSAEAELRTWLVSREDFTDA